MNNDLIIQETLKKIECILNNFLQTSLEKKNKGTLNVNSMEDSLKTLIKAFIGIVLGLSGEILSSINNENEKICSCCGRKMKKVAKNRSINILSIFGIIPLKRDYYFCRNCGIGYGDIDKKMDFHATHRITKGLIETITYMAQLVPSFERASESIYKLLNLEISSSQIQIISEEIGKKIFDDEIKKSEEIYENINTAIPQIENKKSGRLYIMTDGSAINTRIEDTNGSTWKEMKLGLVFHDKNMINRGNGTHKITKKEYVSYLGSVENFKKMLLTTAINNGYGTIEEVVVIGDGAHWIWNMCKEIFPDAITILDYYHFSENVHKYGDLLYPKDEFSKKKWVKEIEKMAKSGEIDKILETIKLTEVNEIPAGYPNLYNYIKNNKERINYKRYKEEGYIIGSGAIESGNKMVIQQRMKQSGMRWGVKGGQYISTLRSKHESNLWNEVINAIA